ncbi:hypothetical protein ASPZODRAFT_95133 [Penicilliopsis zonata CBS 506.65]|uniref:Enoyl reductase (ER) domain-containing protein n=1 Tax=Penicilliopsis zonata CBS 506.65 TaxID=1073090 RepID=A0A1L9SLM8_9EURO|nr:hypothetical protein ASPZODRAFT_95133 [Penicilliopsis zonata CBS 506.65]OJJ48006.1 hypothetical protein ASPZODRAFT_95133 [Penicilliopsis zonata CBS 506.65]
MMKAVQVQEFNAPYHVSEVPKPVPQPHQVLVRIKAGGFCHTDLMALNHEFKDTRLPFIASHEPAGIIEAVGDQVTEFKVGDRVGTINMDTSCGKCPDCKAGIPVYCEGNLMKGITADGAWAEYMVSDARFTVKLPDEMDFKTAAPLMCAGITIYRGIVQARVPKGGSIGIVGIGGLGHIGTQVAKCMGYKVAAVDVKQSALDTVNAYEYRPDVCLLATDPVEKSLEQIATTIGGEYPGLDATILATDHPAALKLSIDLTRKHGTLVLLGQPEAGFQIPFHTFVFKDLTLIGSLIADIDQAKELLDMFTKYKLQVAVKEWKLEEAEQLRQEYLAGGSIGKNVIVFD